MKKNLLYFALLINLVIIFGFWWSGSGAMIFSGDFSLALLSLGRITGLLLVFFVLLQVLLMGRTTWIEKTFGFDRLARVHRSVGMYLSIFLISHPLFIIWNRALDGGVSFTQAFYNLLKYGDDIPGATIGFILFLLVIVTSIKLARKKMKYELWYFVHLGVYLAILTSFGHQISMGGDLADQKIFAAYWILLYVFVFGNLLVLRFMRPVLIYYKYSFKVKKVVPETADTVSIYIAGKDIDKFSFEPGQFAIFRFLAKAMFWQEHPFSFSCMPGQDFLRITVKASGDYTSALQKINPGTGVVIDGPWGIFTPARSKNKKILLIAGGAGIAPVRAVLEKMLQEGRDLVLLYASKTEPDIILRRELEAISSNRSGFRIHHVLSNDASWRGEKGFIDEEKIKRLVGDVSERDAYLCCPPPMIAAVVKLLIKLGMPENKIYYEKFEL